MDYLNYNYVGKRGLVFTKSFPCPVRLSAWPTEDSVAEKAKWGAQADKNRRKTKGNSNLFCLWWVFGKSYPELAVPWRRPD